MKLLTLPLTVDKSDTDLMIKLATGSEIWIIGFDQPERFEGPQWHGGCLDEFGDMKATVWSENVFPALTDTKGWCLLTGVPAGKNHYYELSQMAKSGRFPQFADYSWFSSDVIDEEEINLARSQLDERTFRQEFEGSFESYEGRAYVYYESTLHRKPLRFNPDLPLCIACDFNLDPCIWLFGQDDSGTLRVIDEIKQRQTDIWKMCAETRTRLEALLGNRARKASVVFYGDYEHGKTRSLSATSTSWQILRDEFGGWNTEFRLKSHPRILDRVNSVNSKLRSADGSVKVQIDMKAVELHKDFEMVSLEELQGTKKDVGDRTHASDAFGYWCNYEYPIQKVIGIQQ